LIWYLDEFTFHELSTAWLANENHFAVFPAPDDSRQGIPRGFAGERGILAFLNGQISG